VTLVLWLLGCVDADAPHKPGDDTPIVFEVPSGATAGRLGPALLEQDLIDGELQWKFFLRSADAGCLKAGRFQLSRSMSMNELLANLCASPMADDAPFTVVEGWRIRDIDAALVGKGWIEPGAYTEVATSKSVTLPFEINSPTLEGYLYPETYRVPASDFKPSHLIDRQLATFQERFLVKHGEKLGGRSLHEVVVMASMLEREEPKPKNRPLVAGILWKRIDTNNALGVDATSRYTLKDWNDRKSFLKNLRDPDEPYNSRLRKGLPPTAIGNPTVSSLEASLQPEASAYWYYLHDKNQNLHPAVDGAGHEANRAKYDVY
jgi:UPF0755 protein